MLYVNYISLKNNFLRTLFLNKVTFASTRFRTWIYLFGATIQYIWFSHLQFCWLFPHTLFKFLSYAFPLDRTPEVHYQIITATALQIQDISQVCTSGGCRVSQCPRRMGKKQQQNPFDPFSRRASIRAKPYAFKIVVHQSEHRNVNVYDPETKMEKLQKCGSRRFSLDSWVC